MSYLATCYKMRLFLTFIFQYCALFEIDQCIWIMEGMMTRKMKLTLTPPQARSKGGIGRHTQSTTKFTNQASSLLVLCDLPLLSGSVR